MQQIIVLTRFLPMNRPAFEMNFDGLVGPTHNYSGLSYGNTASMQHAQQLSSPKNAALQGLEKMRLLQKLGIKQGILPPHERPCIPILRTLGFVGKEEEIIAKAWKEEPAIFLNACSASPMWAANAATVSPSADSKDERVHFTPANLISNFHRSFEAITTGYSLFRIFNHPGYFAHHPPLPYQPDYADEGAANHTRLCKEFGGQGVQLFVYGKQLDKGFPARQSEPSSTAMTRLHRLRSEHVLYAEQNPRAIQAGVFHNDVISLGHQNVFLFHEHAFVETDRVIDELQKRMPEIICLRVADKEISLEEAVKTYLFNSQIVTLEDQSMVLIASKECEDSQIVHAFLQNLINDKSQPIRKVIYCNIRESMQNGGGPACLRLRVVLTKQEYQAIHHGVELTDTLYHSLVAWVNQHYRDRLFPSDLADPLLFNEGREALDELSRILNLSPFYSFQKHP